MWGDDEVDDAGGGGAAAGGDVGVDAVVDSEGELVGVALPPGAS